jgi:hypothetical protein
MSSYITFPRKTLHSGSKKAVAKNYQAVVGLTGDNLLGALGILVVGLILGVGGYLVIRYLL